MKRTSLILATSMAALVTSLAPASAGFYFEGLAPFAGRYCQDVDPTLTDPAIVAPQIDWETDSADANSNGGRPAYDAIGCQPEGKGDRAKTHVRAPIPVPQK